RELDPGRLVRRARTLEPRLRVVETDRAGAGACERARPLGGAAAQLEHVLPRNVAEHLQLCFRNLPQPPGQAALDEAGVPLVVLGALAVPELAVLARVLGQVRRVHGRTRARARAAPIPASPSRAPGFPAWRAQDRRGSFPERTRPGWSSPSRCGRPKSRTRPRAPARGSAPR